MTRRAPHPLMVRLNNLRLAQGLSVRELATLVGTPPTSVHNWLSGAHSPRFEDAMAVAEALGCQLVLQEGAPPVVIDEAKVTRVLDGGRVSLNRREMREAARRLDTGDLSANAIAKRLGITERTVQRYRRARRMEAA